MQRVSRGPRDFAVQPFRTLVSMLPGSRGIPPVFLLVLALWFSFLCVHVCLCEVVGSGELELQTVVNHAGAGS